MAMASSSAAATATGSSYRVEYAQGFRGAVNLLLPAGRGRLPREGGGGQRHQQQERRRDAGANPSVTRRDDANDDDDDNRQRRPTVILRHLVLTARAYNDDANTRALYFTRFVTALQQLQHVPIQPPRRQGRGRQLQWPPQQRQHAVAVPAIQKLVLNVDWNGLPTDIVDTLFGTVLPHHPTVQEIDLCLDHLSLNSFRRFAEAISARSQQQGTSTLTKLRVYGSGTIEPASRREEIVQVLVTVLNQGTEALTKLTIDVLLSAEQCQRICHAIQSGGGANNNNQLASLSLLVKDVFVDTLDGLNLNTQSASLRTLHVRAVSYSDDDAVPSLARQLRNNTTLEWLTLTLLFTPTIVERRPHDYQSLLDVLATSNYTLHHLYVNLGSSYNDDNYQRSWENQVVAQLKRNARIRTVFDNVRGPDSDPDPAAFDGGRRQRVVVHNRVLPLVLGLVSHHPTALFRFLKLGYVHTIGTLLDRRRAATAHVMMMDGSTTTASSATSTTAGEREPPCDQGNSSSAKRRRTRSES